MPKRTLQGVVVSDKQNKTVVVRVDRRFTHPIYQKTIRTSEKYHAHDERNEFNLGDRVWIEETRPISKLKKWIVTRGEKAKGQSVQPSSNRDAGSGQNRNEPSTESLRRGNINQALLPSGQIKDFGVAFDQLVAQILGWLALNPASIPELAGARLSFILGHMDASAINGRIEKLLYQLDSSDKDAVSTALTTLSIVLPRLDLDACLRDDELRKTLYGIPDRLMAALSENLDTRSAAKKAAFALVAAMFPQHYSGSRVAANEKTALTDLETIFQQNNVTSFFTLNTKGATDVASVEARLWNGVPFELDGVKPSLVETKLLGARGDLDICQLKGAKKVDVVKTKRDRLVDGQFGALTARLKPDPDSAVHNKVVVYFGNDRDVYRREVFDLGTLFPNRAPT